MPKPDPSLLHPARYPVSMEIPTRFQDVDSNKHINNVAIAGIFEDARIRFENMLGRTREGWDERNRVMLASLQIEYLGEARYPDPIIMHMAVLRVGRTSWTVATLGTQGETLVSYLQATMVCVGSQGPTPLLEAFRSKLENVRLTPALDSANGTL